MKKINADTFRATGLFLSGFQSILEPTYIPLKPLTFLYGPNSAGKSAVMDAIGLLEDIAGLNFIQIYEKLARWQHRKIDETRERLQSGRTKNTEREFNLPLSRVGVEFIFPTNWNVYLGNRTKEFRTHVFDEQQHLRRLGGLVGHAIQFDVGITSRDEPMTIRLAIDHKPVFEMLRGDRDDGFMYSMDSSFRKAGDAGHNEDDDHYFFHGPLRLYPEHFFWSQDSRIDELKQFADSHSSLKVAALVSRAETAINLYDVLGDGEHIQGSWRPFHFTTGSTFSAAMECDHKNRDLARGRIHNANQFRLRHPGIPRALSDLNELLEELAAFCTAILELGAVSVTRVHVSGSRHIFTSDDVTFSGNEGIDPRADKSKADLPYSTYAQHLAYQETKNRKLRRHLPLTGRRPDHRLINNWLLATLPSLRGYRLRVDAFQTSPLSNKRRPLAEGDRFSFRLYLVDAQDRHHEFADVGSGFSYLFPILMALWNGPWATIEQPELHLHPAAQCDIADVFINAMNIGHYALVESHSENLLLRVLRRIRETTSGTQKNKALHLKPEDVSVIYFDPQFNGTTKVKNLRISRDGDFLDRWPAGFFEERVKEFFGE